MKIPKLLLIPILIIAVMVMGMPACTSTEEASFNAWLNSPTTQSELADMQGFAFDLLMAYVESNVGVVRHGDKLRATAPLNFAPYEAATIADVEKKYNLNSTQATYIVKRAEAQVAASLSSP